jgi:predicted amidohydrolase
VTLGRAPLALDNRLAFVTSTGEVVQTYRKHHPVPGEPLIASVPVGRIGTRYAKIGDTAVAFTGAWLALAFALALRGWLRSPDQGART